MIQLFILIYIIALTIFIFSTNINVIIISRFINVLLFLSRSQVKVVNSALKNCLLFIYKQTNFYDFSMIDDKRMTLILTVKFNIIVRATNQKFESINFRDRINTLFIIT